MRWGIAGGLALLAAVEAQASRRYLEKWKTTTDYYEYMIGLTPDTAILHQNLGRAYAYEADQAGQRGSAQESQTLREKARVSLERSVVLFRPLVETRPRDFAVYNALGDVLDRLGRREEALVNYERAMELAGSDADGYNKMGWLYYTLKKYDRAIAMFEKSLETDPDFTEARLNLGQVLSELGRFEESLRQSEEAVRRRPDSADAQCGLGMSLGEMARELERAGQFSEATQKFREAAQCFEKALEADPKHEKSHLFLGNIYLIFSGGPGECQLLEKALGHYRQAERIGGEKAPEARVKAEDVGKLISERCQ